MPDLAAAHRRTLMDDLTPTIVSAVQANKADIIAAAGNTFQRGELAVAWPVAVNILPGVLAHVYAAVLPRLAAITVGELATRFVSDTETMQARESLHI